MLQGKFYFALHFLSCHSPVAGGVLNLNAQMPVSSSNGDTEIIIVCKVLLDKHPLGKTLHPSTLLDFSPDIVNPIIFDGLNADAIHYPLYKPQVLMVPLVWKLLPGIVCAALLNQPLLHCALLWLLLDIQYVQKLSILTGYLPS